MSTINDFITYQNLSGHVTYSYKACAVCIDDSDIIYLLHGNKMSYVGHRNLLCLNHNFWGQKKASNGKEIIRFATPSLTKKQMLCMLKGNTFKQFGKPKLKWKDVDKHVKGKKRKAKIIINKIVIKDDRANTRILCWKKKSIFWDFLISVACMFDMYRMWGILKRMHMKTLSRHCLIFLRTPKMVLHVTWITNTLV